MHRQFSLQPYSSRYSHATDCFLDFLAEGPNGSVVVRDEDKENMLHVLRKYREVREKNMLLFIPFVTVNDYLHELRAISRAMQPLGNDGLLYLAAAVSDFFVPVRSSFSLLPLIPVRSQLQGGYILIRLLPQPSQMSEHKIQSRDIPTEKVSAAKEEKPDLLASSVLSLPLF